MRHLGAAEGIKSFSARTFCRQYHAEKRGRRLFPPHILALHGKEDFF
jgi:hypothetical protein